MRKQNKSIGAGHDTPKFGLFIALLIKWSGIAVTDGRGKVGGTVLSKSRGGATARNKVSPSQPRTPNQSAIRATFAGFSQQFRTLGESVINAWNSLANSGLTVTNIFGDVVRLSGINLFVRLNQNLNLAGVGAITNPPSLSDSAGIVASFAPNSDVSSTELFAKSEFVGGGSTVPANNKLMVFATPKLSPGITNATSKLRFLTTIAAAADTDTTNIWSDYTAKFGAPAVGDNIILAVQCVQTSSGFTGVPQTRKVTIQA